MDRDLGNMLRERMIEQRRIMVSGPLDGVGAASLATQLMALDGMSAEDVDLMLTSPGGPLTEIFPVLDVLGLMRAQVNTTAIGAVDGTAAAVLVCSSGVRRAAPHATVSLRLDRAANELPRSQPATAEQLAQQADDLASVRIRYTEMIATATGLDHARIAAELDNGERHRAGEAVELGIIDGIFDRSEVKNHKADNPAERKERDR